MKIAICDDTKTELKTTESLLNEYASVNNIQLEIESFNDPSVLLNKINYYGTKDYDLFLLDIIMQINGISVADEIRKILPDAFIIFTTTSKEYAVDAFKVRAHNYLLKPIEKKELFSSLNRILEEMKKTPKNIIKFKTDDFSLISLDIKTIAYIESTDRRMVLNLINKKQIKSPSMRSKFLESIPFDIDQFNFINCHSSYVVNMQQVKAIDANNFIMKTGEKIPISKRLYTQVKDKYIKYLVGE